MLQASNLVRKIGKKTLVDRISFQVGVGQTVGLFGPNGAGKSTSFLMIAGLIKPHAGKIWLDGQDVTAWPLYKKARFGLRYLPQESSIFRGMNVEENILSALELLVPQKTERRRQLEDLLNRFYLQEIRKRHALNLSGGQRRRVEIARALAGNVRYLMLDEPLAGLDPKSIYDMIQLIRSLADQKIGILLTEHNVRDMLPIVDYAYILYEGKMLFQGTAQEIAENPEVRKYYLGPGI